MYLKLFQFSGLVYAPLAIGAALRHWGLLRRDHSGRIMTATWLTLEPIAALIIFWSLDLKQIASVVSAPVLGGIWMIAMLAPAAFAARMLKLSHVQRGNFLLAAMFSNNGITLGAFICLVFLGINGQAMGQVFVLSFMPLLLTVGFGIGRRSIRRAANERSAADRASAAAACKPAGNPDSDAPPLGLIRTVPYVAMAIGLVLNITGARRPDFALLVNKGVVFLDVAVYSFAIGTLFTLASVRRYIRECLAMSALKFVVSPAVGLLLFFAASRVLDLDPVLLKVMIVQCAMPVAIMSVVVSRFCRLDTELAAGCWVFTTLAVAGLVPVLAYIVAHVPG